MKPESSLPYSQAPANCPYSASKSILYFKDKQICYTNMYDHQSSYFH